MRQHLHRQAVQCLPFPPHKGRTFESPGHPRTSPVTSPDIPGHPRTSPVTSLTSPEISGHPRTSPVTSRTSPDIPGYLRIPPDISGHLRTSPEIPGYPRTSPVTSPDIPRHPRTSPDIPGHPRTSPDIPGHLRTSRHRPTSPGDVIGDVGRCPNIPEIIPDIPRTSREGSRGEAPAFGQAFASRGGPRHQAPSAARGLPLQVPPGKRKGSGEEKRFRGREKVPGKRKG